MWTRQHKQTNAGRLIVPALCAVVLSYFGYHAYHGAFGINSRAKLQAQVASLQEQLAIVKERRMEIEQRVRLLHDGSLEKDMLDEQARRSLNVTGANEVVIMLPAKAN